MSFGPWRLEPGGLKPDSSNDSLGRGLLCTFIILIYWRLSLLLLVPASYTLFLQWGYVDTVNILESLASYTASALLSSLAKCPRAFVYTRYSLPQK